MFYAPYLYDWSPLYLVQIGLTIWMLIDANRRGVDYYWFWIILAFQPFGAWAYFFLYKVRDFRHGSDGLTGLFHRPPSLQELRHRTEQSPTLANRLDLAERLVETGSYAEAQPHFQAMLDREPNHCRALFLLAQCHRGLGRPEQAVPLLERLLAQQRGWNDYRAWRTLVETHDTLGNRGGALAQCRELAQAAPSLEHRCLLAEHLVREGEGEEARKVVQQGLEDYRYLSGPSRRRDRRWVGKAKQLLRQLG